MEQLKSIDRIIGKTIVRVSCDEKIEGGDLTLYFSDESYIRFFVANAEVNGYIAIDALPIHACEDSSR